MINDLPQNTTQRRENVVDFAGVTTKINSIYKNKNTNAEWVRFNTNTCRIEGWQGSDRNVNVKRLKINTNGYTIEY